MKVNTVSEYSEPLYNSVLRLLPQLSAKLQQPSREFFKDVLKSESIDFFIAEADDNTITGMLTLAKYPNVTGVKFWIEDVVVDDAFRGHGIGELLVNAALEHARFLGANEVKLTSRPSREAANRLYRKIGFVQYETNVYKYILNPS